MSARLTIRTPLKWVLTILVLVSVGAWGVSGYYRIAICFGPTMAGIEAGRVMVLGLPEGKDARYSWSVGIHKRKNIAAERVDLALIPSFEKWAFFDYGARWRWGGGISFPDPTTQRFTAAVPFWFSTVLLLPPAVLMWRFDLVVLRRRRKTGACVECGYDRDGLAVETPCPECGKVTV